MKFRSYGCTNMGNKRIIRKIKIYLASSSSSSSLNDNVLQMNTSRFFASVRFIFSLDEVSVLCFILFFILDRVLFYSILNENFSPIKNRIQVLSMGNESLILPVFDCHGHIPRQCLEDTYYSCQTKAIDMANSTKKQFFIYKKNNKIPLHSRFRQTMVPRNPVHRTNNFHLFFPNV